MYDNDMILQGQRLADHLLKACKKETPPAATIGLAMCLAVASKTAGINRTRLIELIDLFLINYHSTEAELSAQDALSSLVIPR